MKAVNCGLQSCLRKIKMRDLDLAELEEVAGGQDADEPVYPDEQEDCPVWLS